MNESINDFLDRLERTAGQRWKEMDRDRLWMYAPQGYSRRMIAACEARIQKDIIEATRTKFVQRALRRLS